MFPPVKIVSGGLEIREFGSQDAVQVVAFVAAGDRTALRPGSPGAVADVDGWLAETVHQRRLDGGGVHLAIVEAWSNTFAQPDAPPQRRSPGGKARKAR